MRTRVRSRGDETRLCCPATKQRRRSGSGWRLPLLRCPPKGRQTSGKVRRCRAGPASRGSSTALPEMPAVRPAPARRDAVRSVLRCAGAGVQRDHQPLRPDRAGWLVMDAQMLMALIVGTGGVYVVVWVLQKVGKAIAAVLEALAAVAMVFLALWLVIKA